MMSSAFLFFFERFISCSARYTASSSAVEPLDFEKRSSFSIAPVSEVSGSRSLGALSNSTRQNSSWGLAMRKNSLAAARERISLSPMLPLVSKTRQTETGSSSIANCVIGCGTLSSKTRKFSFSRPETGRLSGSLTVTGTRISVVSTRILGTRAGASCFGTGLGRCSILTCALSAHARPIANPAAAPANRRMFNGPLDGIVHSGGRENSDGKMCFPAETQRRRGKRRGEPGEAKPENADAYIGGRLVEPVFVFSALVSASLRQIGSLTIWERV